MTPPAIRATVRSGLLVGGSLRSSGMAAAEMTTWKTWTPRQQRSATATPSSVSWSSPRGFSTTRQLKGTNHVYPPIRHPSDLHTYILLSSSSRQPLLVLWTASWCPTCRAVAPLLRSLVDEHKIGEAEGGVRYVEVEYDSPDVMSSSLGMDYMVNSIPTLMSFDAGEVQEGRVKDGGQLGDRGFLEGWIRREARRRGERGGGGDGKGGGGGGGGGLLGGLFGSWR